MDEAGASPRLQELEQEFRLFLGNMLAAECSDRTRIDAWLDEWFREGDGTSPLGVALATAIGEEKADQEEALKRLLAAQRLVTAAPEQTEWHGFPLASFELYLAPSTARDKLHSAVVHCFSERQQQMFISTVAPVAAGTQLMRSPIRVGVRDLRLSAAQRAAPLSDVQFLECGTAAAGLLLQGGCLTPSSPHFAPQLCSWLELLAPRPRAALQSYDELVDLLNDKVLCNAIGRVGTLDCALLDRGSFFNHCCAPNTHRVVDEVLREARFYSLVGLPRAAQALISYIRFPVDSRRARRALFAAQQQHFDCHCRCCLADAPPSLAFAELTVRLLVQQGQQQRTRCVELASLHCWWCGAPTQKQCSGCGRAGYCSAACQRRNYETHRQICARLAVQVFSCTITIKC